MKRTLIALAVTAAVAAPMVAQAAPKVYGKLNMTIENRDFDDETKQSVWEVVSNDSRFGVKGEDELTATLSAVYQIEWGVSGDGDGTDLSQRNRFIGLKHQDLGTLKLGKYDTYLKLAQGKVDLFNDLYGDMKYIIAGEDRVNDVIGYESPKIADALTINVMLQPGEQSGDGDEFNGPADAISTSVVYDNSDAGLYLALAYNKEMASAALLESGDRHDTLRAVASYKIADLTLNAIFNTSEVADETSGNDGEDEEGWMVGAAYKLGESNTIKLQYGMAEADVIETERSMWSLGLEHALTSKTKVYGFYTLKNEDDGVEDLDQSSIAVGVEHNF